MADIDDILDRLSRDSAFRDEVRSDPRRALEETSLSTDDLARVQDALGPASTGPSVRSLFTASAGSGGKAGLIGLLLPVLAAVGLLIGFAGGAAGLAGGSSTTLAAPLTPVSVLDCPGGEPIGTLHRGDRVLVTGTDESGDYLQIRDITNLDRRVWVAASVVVTDQASDIEVRPADAGCERHPVPGGVETAAAPGAELETTTTTVADTTTLPNTTSASSGASPATTTPGPTSTTSTAADNTPPSIAGTNASPTEIWENYAPAGGLCSTQTTTIVSAKVTDASALGPVTLSWSIGKVNGSSAMNPIGGGTYRATLGPFPYLTVPDGTVGQINVTVTATDSRGNLSTASITVPLHSASECIG